MRNIFRELPKFTLQNSSDLITLCWLQLQRRGPLQSAKGQSAKGLGSLGCAGTKVGKTVDVFPKHSMYGIITYIWVILWVNVDK